MVMELVELISTQDTIFLSLAFHMVAMTSMMTNVTLLLATLRITVTPTKSETVVLSTWLIWIKDRTMFEERSEATSVISLVLVSLVSVLMLASTCGQAIWKLFSEICQTSNGVEDQSLLRKLSIKVVNQSLLVNILALVVLLNSNIVSMLETMFTQCSTWKHWVQTGE